MRCRVRWGGGERESVQSGKAHADVKAAKCRHQVYGNLGKLGVTDSRANSGAPEIKHDCLLVKSLVRLVREW